MADGFEVAVVGMIIEQLADVELAYPTFTAVVGLAARRARDYPAMIPPPRRSWPLWTAAERERTA